MSYRQIIKQSVDISPGMIYEISGKIQSKLNSRHPVHIYYVK